MALLNGTLTRRTSMNLFPASAAKLITHTPLDGRERTLNQTAWSIYYLVSPPTVSICMKLGKEKGFAKLEDYRRRKTEVRICKLDGCDKPLPPKAAMSKRYCSDTCTVAGQKAWYLRNQQHNKDNATKAPCVMCEKLFPKWRRDQNCCSPECGKLYRAHKSRDSRKNGTRKKWKSRAGTPCETCAEYTSKCLDLLCAGTALPEDKSKCWTKEPEQHPFESGRGRMLGNNSDPRGIYY